MITELIASLQELEEAKELLNEILSHYNVYGRQFADIPNNAALELNDRIRKYIKFDDSE